MVDEVPEAIKGKVQLAYIKDVIKRDLPEDEEEDSDDLDTNEDEEFAEIAEADEKIR